jgi:hypothetical protein
MARKKKAVAKKAVAKRGPGRPPKAGNVGHGNAFNSLKERVLDSADEVTKLQVGLLRLTKCVDQLVDRLDGIGGVGHLHASLTVHGKIIEDVRERANDTLYRLELVEDRLRQGPGLLPMLVTEGTDLNNLSPRTLAQLLLDKLARIPEEPSA